MSSIFDAIPKTESRPNYVVDIERFIGAPGSFTFREPKASDTDDHGKVLCDSAW